MLASAAVLFSTVAAAVERGQSQRVERGQVKVICTMTVGGAFEAKTTALAGTLTPAADASPMEGSLALDLRTLDTGIGLRNDHMRNEYLEVGKGPGYQTAVLSEISLSGKNPDSVQGRTPFTAMLLLHGVSRPVSGQAEIRREGDSATHVEASFPVALSDYGITKPQYLGIGVRNDVLVKVAFTATPDALKMSTR